MPRPRKKRTFFKIKEKLVFVTPKKFFGKKILGIICLISGSLILTFSLVYFYLIPKLLPRFVPPQKEIVEVKEAPEPFSAQRVLIPEAGIDLRIEGGSIKGEAPPKIERIEGKEVLVLGKSSYRIYKVVLGQTQAGKASPTLVIQDGQLRLVLPLSTQRPTYISIEAQGE